MFLWMDQIQNLLIETCKCQKFYGDCLYLVCMEYALDGLPYFFETHHSIMSFLCSEGSSGRLYDEKLEDKRHLLLG